MTLPTKGQGALSGALSGAGTGASVGSLFGPVGTGIGGLVGGIAGGIGGGMLGRRKEQTIPSQETPIQGRQRELLDQLLGSLQGNGPFSNLFQADEGAFQRSIVDPAMQRFQSQIAPNIQQQFIAGGQQRGTGLEDTLARAGVDLNQMINQQYLPFQQAGLERKQRGLESVLGAGAGAMPEQTLPGQGFGEAAGQGLAGFLSGPGFGQAASTIGGGIGDILSRGRRGFEQPLQKQPFQDPTANLPKFNINEFLNRTPTVGGIG